MIGETAFERKHGGRRLGVIVGQRTSNDAEGRPVAQWEIRSARGIKFFVPKADVRLAGEPEPEPEASSGEETAADRATRIAEALRAHRSAAPTVITLVGIALCLACAAIFALGLDRKFGELYGSAIAAVPGLVGLIIILVGTNLIGEQARRLKQLRRKYEEEGPPPPAPSV
jgi:hypothetical protein